LTPERFLEQWRVAIRVGWVTDKPLARQLTEHVEEAVRAVRRGNRSAAREVLAAIQKLVGQHQKHIEPEAQALLLESLPYIVR
jgi:hemerythrin-like domain-containing protein